MRKQRYYPLGYEMKYGKIVLHQEESELVVEIFSHYKNGLSYQKIADLLTCGTVPYHTGTPPNWNKNMIKRILEDYRYLGGEYPAIIDRTTFGEVQNLICSKAQKPYKQRKRKLATEFICGICAKMLDKSKISKNILVCINPNCSEYGQRKNKADIENLLNQPRQDTESDYGKLYSLKNTEQCKEYLDEIVLIKIAEQSASLHFIDIQNQKKPPILFDKKLSLLENFSDYKTVILTPNHIEVT